MAKHPNLQHKIVEGDTLSAIALLYTGDAANWPKLHDLNRNVIGPNPDVLGVGDEIVIPWSMLGKEHHDRAFKEQFQIGGLIHTAMRKGVDTKWSVIIWNVMHLMTPEDENAPKRERAWPHFCKHAQKFWMEGVSASEAMKKWAAMRDDYRIPDADRMPNSHGAITLATAIKMVDDSTWSELDATIDYWMKEERGEHSWQKAKAEACS